MFSLASKHNDPNASLAWSERIGYGTGGFAFNMINGIIGSFLTIYFTSTVGPVSYTHLTLPTILRV